MIMYICNRGDKDRWFRLGDRTWTPKVLWVVVYQVSQKTHKVSPTNLSQALCAPDRNLPNYSPYEGSGVCYYAGPPGAGFHMVPPCALRFFRLCHFPSPGSSRNMAVNLTPAHSWESSHLLLGKHLMDAWIGLETAVPGPASCSPWRARLGAQPGNRG